MEWMIYFKDICACSFDKELTAFLRNSQIDAAFILGREMYAPDLVSEILAFEQVVLVSGTSHTITRKIPLTTRIIN